MGRYVSQPLSVNCQSIHDVRQFLCGCRGVSDEELFGKRDYWQPPEEFEIRKKGDCDDFALWTWRQLLSMGYDARVVFGSHGRYGIGHAWVQYCRGGKWFLMEPTVPFLGETLPRLSTTLYHPKFSVAWADEKLSYYAHEDRKFSPSFPQLVTLLYEWVRIWG
ncbi:MAG TPA: transglutaminase domain-containing protein, partial [Terriglobales bacterium]|nr:transglutaminase domain-containing protein [Terriglobales bacterium]